MLLLKLINRRHRLMTYLHSLRTNRANVLCLFIACLLLTSCINVQHSPNEAAKHINFLIDTDKESPHTYGEDGSAWQITTNLIETKEVPKTFFYNFTIQSLNDEFKVSNIKSKYGEYGKWRTLEIEKFINLKIGERFAKQQTLQKVPITILKTGNAHMQVFEITLAPKNKDDVSLALVFGVNKCISKKDKEALCF